MSQQLLLFAKVKFYLDTFSGDYYQTQYEMLRSSALADETLERLKLYESQEYIGKLKGKNDSYDKLEAIFREQLSSGQIIGSPFGVICSPQRG